MLPWAQYWYNCEFHHSMGMPSYQAVYGKPPPSLIRYEYNEDDPPTIQDNLKMRDALLRKLKVKLQQSQNYMKRQVDKTRRDVPLEVEDLALIKLQPYRQRSVMLRMNQKLSLRYFGPFEFIEKIGHVAFNNVNKISKDRYIPSSIFPCLKSFMEIRRSNTSHYCLLQMNLDTCKTSQHLRFTNNCQI